MEQLKEEKMMAEKSKFEEELEKLNINLTEHQKEQFDRYYEMLVEWNNVMNLTGITDYDEVNLKHFTDSLTLVSNRYRNRSRFSRTSDKDSVSAYSRCFA